MADNSINDAVNSITSQIPGAAKETKPARHMKKVGGLVEKSPGRKIAEAFFDEDLDEFKKSFFKDMVRPAMRDFVFSIIQRLFYGGGPRVNSGNFINLGSSLVRDYVPNQSGYTNYQNIGQKAAPAKTGKFDFSDLIFRDMASAKDLINEMNATIAYQGYVTVTDLYDSLDKIGYLDVTDNYWGWYNLANAQIRPVKTGYQVLLPQPVQIGK